MTETEFLEELQSYMDLNNHYLQASDKYIFRGEAKTPRDNLVERFGTEKADKLLTNLSASRIESKHKLQDPLCKKTIYALTQKLYPYLELDQGNHILLKSMYPKSLDSS